MLTFASSKALILNSASASRASCLVAYFFEWYCLLEPSRDIKETNIMIDVENNPIFIEIDNYAYEDFAFDFFPARCECLEKAYQKPAALKDNDIYVFSLMALKLLTKNGAFNCFESPEEINTALMELDIKKEIKNGLQLIFSDSKDKPYFGEVFKK